jgi:hypothetical protein
MIDTENLPKIVSSIKSFPHRQIIAYLSKNHHLVESTFPKHVIQRVSPSTRPDGCDILMAMDCMNLPAEFPKLSEIWIMSRDKFASAVVDNFNVFFPDIKVFHEAIWRE